MAIIIITIIICITIIIHKTIKDLWRKIMQDKILENTQVIAEIERYKLEQEINQLKNKKKK